MEIIFAIFVFLLGAIVGSFLNVVIVRYNTGVSPLSGRSMCFSCGKTLRWYELVPIVSFLVARGRCRSCKSAISWQYIIVETITALMFVAVFLHDTSIIAMMYHLAAFCALIVVGTYDLRHKIIPDGVIYFFIILSFLGLLFVHAGAVTLPTFNTAFLRDLAAGPIIAAPFAGLWYFSRGTWMGFGDAKLALGMGWFLGFAQVLVATVLAFWVGALVGLALIALGKLPITSARFKRFGAKSEIPFGPFLILGTLIAFFFGLSPLFFVIL